MKSSFSLRHPILFHGMAAFVYAAFAALVLWNIHARDIEDAPPEPISLVLALPVRYGEPLIAIESHMKNGEGDIVRTIPTLIYNTGRPLPLMWLPDVLALEGEMYPRILTGWEKIEYDLETQGWAILPSHWDDSAAIEYTSLEDSGRSCECDYPQ